MPIITYLLMGHYNQYLVKAYLRRSWKNCLGKKCPEMKWNKFPGKKWVGEVMGRGKNVVGEEMSSGKKWPGKN
jgi:hypothetical protein